MFVRYPFMNFPLVMAPSGLMYLHVDEGWKGEVQHGQESADAGGFHGLSPAVLGPQQTPCRPAHPQAPCAAPFPGRTHKCSGGSLHIELLLHADGLTWCSCCRRLLLGCWPRVEGAPVPLSALIEALASELLTKHASIINAANVVKVSTL